MPPLLVLILCYCFIAWLMRKDMKWRDAGSWALLIPGAWITILGSRPVSYWFDPQSGVNNLDASPINTVTMTTLMVAAVVVLQRRGLKWGGLIRENKALFLIYFYLAISAAWSEMPFVSLKRLIKDFGCVLAALVILTETNPSEAVRTIFVRVSYLLFPLSLIIGKYFPEIGREYAKDGTPMFTGITTQKNSLGEMLFVFGLYVLWDLIEIWKGNGGRQKKTQILIRIGMLFMGLWLLITCNSQTSFICLSLGCLVLWGSGRLMRMRHGKRVLIACLAAGISLAALDKTFGLSEIVIRALGRNPTLTGRTDIWQHVMEQKTNPLVGEGFCIFWDTDKGAAVVDALTKINSTHNGYLEMYVDGGLVGVVLLGLLLLLGGKRVIDRSFTGVPLGTMGLIYWLTAIIYNLSESSYFRLDTLWLTLLLMTINCPQNRPQHVMQAAGNGAVRPLSGLKMQTELQQGLICFS
jgi:O-antigen ligase